MSDPVGPNVAFYDCVRCRAPHFERFDYRFQPHRVYQSHHGIRHTTERAATLAVLRDREERQGGAPA